MKICIVSIKFLETTYPLSKYLVDNGLDVTLYSVFPLGSRRDFVVDYSDYDVNTGLDNRFIDQAHNSDLLKYLNGIKLNTFFFDNYLKKRPISNLKAALALAKHIKAQKFDVIHFVGTSPFLYLMHIILGKKVSVHSIHEVVSHEDILKRESMHQRVMLRMLNRKKTEVIVHSRISKERFIDQFYTLKGLKSPIENRLNFIPFSLFETFRCFTNENTHFVEGNSILFFGRITPYKGVCYLLEAVSLLEEEFPDVELVIAGEGDFTCEGDPVKNLRVINKVLDNTELIQEIRNSKVVVCPYTSASQSGIPMVAYLFGKPVVATNVGGLPEVVIDNETGLVVEPKNSQALADALKRLLEDQEFYNRVSQTIISKYSESDSSWQSIAVKTIEVYSKSVK